MLGSGRGASAVPPPAKVRACRIVRKALGKKDEVREIDCLLEDRVVASLFATRACLSRPRFVFMRMGARDALSLGALPCGFTIGKVRLNYIPHVKHEGAQCRRGPVMARRSLRTLCLAGVQMVGSVCLRAATPHCRFARALAEALRSASMHGQGEVVTVHMRDQLHVHVCVYLFAHASFFYLFF